MQKSDMLFLLTLLMDTTAAYSLNCHCLNASTCHSNGYCVQGCERGWYGPGCQVGNVALGKLTKQSTTYNETAYWSGTGTEYVCSADLAVDGNVPNNDTIVYCTHTINQMPVESTNSAWWVVTLDTTFYYVISNITLVNRRSFRERLTNFVILLSNDTESDPNPSTGTWHECARENGTVDYNRTYSCKKAAIAKQVAVYLTASRNNPGAILTLCEVQVYGYVHYDCASGFTGPGCLLRACDHCSSIDRNCTSDFGSCHYDVCPDQSLLPPDCWITLSNFSELRIQSKDTCNNILITPVLPDSKPNIPATLLQLQVTTSADRQMLENANLSLRTSSSVYYNISNAISNTSYDVSVKLLYCDITGSSCFYITGTKTFTLLTGKREYVFSRKEGCVFINVTSVTPDCELPSAIQVTCEAQMIGGVTVNSSNFTTCGLQRDLGYSCSMDAFIDANTIERRRFNISAEPLASLPVPEIDASVLAGSIGGSIALIVLIATIIAIIYYRRQKKSKENPDTFAITGDADGISRNTISTQDATSLPSLTNTGFVVEDAEQTYYNTSGMTLSQFQLYLQNEALIGQRFSELQANETHPCTNGRSPENKGKNRFQNILPYDANRVRLANLINDYINASYINGFSKPKEYIAAQGPSSKTVDDFWHMLWQEKCDVIIMLTDYVENAKRKCEKYFPYSKSHGIDIEVTVRSFSVFDTHAVTVLDVRQGSEVRQVHHFHFLSWPDQSVPSHSADLLLFYSRLRLHLKRLPSRGPLVVHCSAGVGRTGAYIAFDYLQQRYQSECTVDVDSCVVKLRDQRVLMVQTKEQYIFLHRAVMYSLKTTQYLYDAAQLPSLAHNGPLAGSSINLTKATEWQELQAVASTFNKLSFAAAVLPENIAKNRRSQILALESKRPLLSRPDDGRPLYINAVYCNGCYSNRAFIATQVPLRQTVDDFWLMVYQFQPSCIFLLHDLSISDTEDCQCYWPEPGHSTTAGLLEVKCDLMNKEDSAQTAKMPGFYITLSPVSGSMNESQTVSVKLFTTSLWNMKRSAELPVNANDILMVAKALRTYCVAVPRQPIIVQCRDGVTQSGLFMSVVNALHRLIETEQVSVFHTVDLLRTSRPEFITSEAQYRYIYQVLEIHRDSLSIYANS